MTSVAEPVRVSGLPSSDPERSSDRGGLLFVVALLLILAAGAAALLWGGLPERESRPLLLVLGACAATFVAAGALARGLLQSPAGGAAMHVVYSAIREGAEAFMRRQYRTIAVLAVVTAALVYVLYAVVRAPTPDDPAPWAASRLAATLRWRP